MERKISFKGFPVTLVGKELKVGDIAPDFTVLAKDLTPVRLSDFKGKNVVITVFPSIDTGICSLQTIRFNQEITNFSKENVQLITISVDLPFALNRFCGDKNIENAITTSDHRELDFGTKYGFAIKELRLLSRGTLIVDKNGIIKYIEYVPEIGTHPNYENALNTLKNLL